MSKAVIPLVCDAYIQTEGVNLGFLISTHSPPRLMHIRPQVDQSFKAYVAACQRLQRHVNEWASGWGVEIYVSVIFEVVSNQYKIHLRLRQRELIVPFDTTAFVGEDRFFEALVLPQIGATIRKLVTLN